MLYNNPLCEILCLFNPSKTNTIFELKHLNKKINKQATFSPNKIKFNFKKQLQTLFYSLTFPTHTKNLASDLIKFGK